MSSGSVSALVERYAHLMPAGHEAAISAVWHGAGGVVNSTATSASETLSA
jgi:hypothetical protein